MKYLSCLGFILLSTAVCWAQKYKQEQFFLSKGLLDIQAGVAIPIGDFGLSELTLPAGYALTGFNTKIGFSYDIAPYLGVVLQYQYTQNPFNNGQLLADLKQQSSNIIYNSYASNPWKLQGVMLGFYYPFKTDKTTIEIRLLGALLTGLLPESEENITVPALNNRQFNFKQFETTATNFGFETGIKMKYQLYKNLILSSSIDYTYSNLLFENIKVIDTYSGTRFNTDNYTQKFQLLNFSLGVGIQFE